MDDHIADRESRERLTRKATFHAIRGFVVTFVAIVLICSALGAYSEVRQRQRPLVKGDESYRPPMEECISEGLRDGARLGCYPGAICGFGVLLLRMRRNSFHATQSAPAPKPPNLHLN